MKATKRHADYRNSLQARFLDFAATQAGLGTRKTTRELYAWWANVVVVRYGPTWDDIRAIRANLETQGILK